MAVKESLKRMSAELRNSILEKVVRTTFQKRIEDLQAQFRTFAQEMVAKHHAAYFEARKDEAIQKYLVSDTVATFTYRTAKERQSEELEFPTLRFERSGAQLNIKLTCGYRDYIEVSGPSGSYSKLLPVTLTANEGRRLKALERRLKEICDSLPEFISQMRSNLHAAKTLRDFYIAIPELKEIVGISDLNDDVRGFALVPVTTNILAELKKAGLPPKGAANDEDTPESVADAA